MIHNIAIIGAGQMGSGIAHVCAQAGYHVQLVDTSPEQLEKANNSISKSLDRLVNKGIITPQAQEESLQRIQFTPTLQMPLTLDLTIEAIIENKAMKTRLFKALDGMLSPTAILASNTSSISITELAKATNRPDRVIGMHFMNPVPVMPLVELIPGQLTSENTCTTIQAVISQLGKTCVVSKDSPGFIVNRILMPMINEAIFALHEGIANPQDIDTAMCLGTNQPMGPLALADFIGLDTCLSIMQVLHEGFKDDKYRPCPLLAEYVVQGRLGKKSGRGFYDYE